MPIKQVIVVRADLRIGKGKLAAHVAHASLEGYREAEKRNPEVVERWMREGEKKIVVRVSSEKELLEIFERAKGNLPCVLIKDAGLTQIPPGTNTAIALGPWEEKEIDRFTGKLKLL